MPSASAVGMLYVAVLAAAVMALPTSAPTPTDSLPRVRTTSRFLTRLIADGRDQSPTLAAMLAAIERTDVVVYFEAAPRMDTGLRGCVHFMGASAGYRYVRAQIKTSMTSYDVMASIAHELQHALEIARHPEVRSEADLERLYRRIGDEHDWRMFETSDAQRAGRAVRAEILGLD